MTNDAEHRTPADEAIDQVARAMVSGPTPDLRAAIARRLDEGRTVITWWQPAFAAAAVIIAALAWWPTSDDAPHEATRPAAELTVPMPQPVQPASEPPAVAIERATRRPSADVARAPRTRALAVPWLEETTTLPPIEVGPIPIEAIAVEDAAIARVEVPTLAIEPLTIEPLPRSIP